MEPLGSPAEEVAECARRSLAAESARIKLLQELEFPFPEKNERPRRRGGLLRPAIKLASVAGRTAFERASSHWMGELGHEGFIEPSRRRHMHHSDAWAELRKDGTRWGGRPGRPLTMLNPAPERGSAVDLCGGSWTPCEV